MRFYLKKIGFYLVALFAGEALLELEHAASIVFRIVEHSRNADEFAWDSQSATAPESPTGQLFQHHEERGRRIVLFARQHRENRLGPEPYMCLGTVKYISHEGSKPMHIRWSLDRPMPASMFQIAKIAS